MSHKKPKNKEEIGHMAEALAVIFMMQIEEKLIKCNKKRNAKYKRKN